MATEPVDPGSADGWREDHLVEEVEELVDVDVEAHIVFGVLSEHLLIDTKTMRTSSKVVSQVGLAPPDVERQLYLSRSLLQPRIIDVFWDGDRTLCRPQPRAPRPGHGRILRPVGTTARTPLPRPEVQVDSAMPAHARSRSPTS